MPFEAEPSVCHVLDPLTSFLQSSDLLHPNHGLYGRVLSSRNFLLSLHSFAGCWTSHHQLRSSDPARHYLEGWITGGAQSEYWISPTIGRKKRREVKRNTTGYEVIPSSCVSFSVLSLLGGIPSRSSLPWFLETARRCFCIHPLGQLVLIFSCDGTSIGSMEFGDSTIEKNTAPLIRASGPFTSLTKISLSKFYKRY